MPIIVSSSGGSPDPKIKHVRGGIDNSDYTYTNDSGREQIVIVSSFAHGNTLADTSFTITSGTEIAQQYKGSDGNHTHTRVSIISLQNGGKVVVKYSTYGNAYQGFGMSIVAL